MAGYSPTQMVGIDRGRRDRHARLAVEAMEFSSVSIPRQG